MRRRDFITRLGVGSALTGLGNFPYEALLKNDMLKLCILHTNDVHSRIDPFPMDGGRNEGLGGAARRASLINEIRSLEDHVLLLDSGDMFQGTPYFNYFDGEIELKLMSQMGYDAACIGNHDFDAGIESLRNQLDAHANFSIVNSNYEFKDTPMKGKALNYKIFDKGDLKIGVFGLGIQLKGLVPKHWYLETQYLDPIQKGNETASLLKNELNCDYVICLSHLGYKYRESDRLSDIDLAKSSKDIDLILGGHTHTFMRRPDVQANAVGKEINIHQVGFGGIYLGRIDVYFERNTKAKCLRCNNQLVK